MSDFTITPFRINGIHKLIGMSINVYGTEYIIHNAKSSQSFIFIGYVIEIYSDTKRFCLNVNFSNGKVELSEIGSHSTEISKNLHKRDFVNIPKFLHLTRYLMIEYLHQTL